MARILEGMGTMRAVIWLAATVAAFYFASILAPTEASAQTTSAANGKIVYVKRDTAPGEHLNDIWIMDADGSNETNLTNTPDVSEAQPAFSSDGTEVAFNGPGDENEEGDILSDIYVMDADGGNPTNLTNSANFNEFQPSWAPSGAQLAFVREIPGQSITNQPDIFVMDSNGENATNLTQSDASELGPDWSPDGAKIAFSGVRDGGWEILTMDPDGQNESILTGDGSDAFDESPDWSPDSTKVVFMKQSQVGGCCEPWEIWAVNRDGSGDTNLTNHARDDTFPSWSPDGTEITFSSNRNADASGQSDIYAMPAPTTLPPSETASVSPEQSDGLMEFVASDVLMRAADAQTTSRTVVRRLTRGGASTTPDWGKNFAPTITNLRPAVGSATTDRTPLIAAKVTDAQTNLNKSDVTLFLDEIKVARTEFAYDRDTDRLKYTPKTNLSLGEHTVKLVAQDPEGLTTRKVWGFDVAAQQ